MAFPPSASARRQVRPGSLERPVNARTYRGTWLLVAIPLLVAAFSIATPQPLPRPSLPATFDRDSAVALARELALVHPDRRPGSPGGVRAARWVARQLRTEGFRPQSDRFSEGVAGLGRVTLENLYAVAPGRSPDAIVLMAHRDGTGASAGANDNASGTGALLEIARAYANPSELCGDVSLEGRACPTHTLIFLSTDGGAFGGVGAERFAQTWPARHRIVAVVNLDAVAGRARPRLHFASDAPRVPTPVLVRTAAARVAEQTGRQPAHGGALRQLIDLGFPFSLYEHAPFVGDGTPALTLTTAPERPPRTLSDSPDELGARRLGQLGSAAQELVGSLDQNLEFAAKTTSYLYLGGRILPGWSVQLVLFGALVPFLLASVDLFARCRRRRISVAPAWRSLRSRLLFWVWVGGVFALLCVLGLGPEGGARPLSPDSRAAGDWPVGWLLALAFGTAVGWLVARERLLPRRAITADEQLAGYTVALLALSIVALATVATNAFALVFLLPSLHAWLWLPHVGGKRFWARALLLAAGLAGPLVLVWSFAVRYGLGLDAPWYLAALAANGYVPLAYVALLLAWLAAAGQLAALAACRYAPYPGARERPRHGPIRATIRRVARAVRARRDSAGDAETDGEELSY